MKKTKRAKQFYGSKTYSPQKLIAAGDTLIPHYKKFVGLSIILDTIIKKFDRRKPFEGTHRTVVCST